MSPCSFMFLAWPLADLTAVEHGLTMTIYVQTDNGALTLADSSNLVWHLSALPK